MQERNEEKAREELAKLVFTDPDEFREKVNQRNQFMSLGFLRLW